VFHGYGKEVLQDQVRRKGRAQSREMNRSHLNRKIPHEHEPKGRFLEYIKDL
jgi:hypothetical protein